MPAPTDIGQSYSGRQGLHRGNYGETVVAAIWLSFYGLATGVVITSLLVSGAIELAAR